MATFKHALAAGAVALVIATAAVPRPALADGDPRPPLSELISFSAFNELLARVYLLFLRSTVDFTYEDVVNDPYANFTSVTGMTIRPDLPWDRGRNCVVHAERLRMSGVELGQWDRIASRVELSGVTAPLACIPPEAAGTAAIAEVDELTFDRVYVTLDYRMNTSALTAGVHLTMPGLAAVSADLDFDYVSIMPDRRGEPLVADLSHAAVAIEDLGLWAKASRIMPPEMTQPEALAQMVEGGLTEVFAGMNAQGPQTAPGAPPKLDPAQQAFIRAAAAQAQAFAEKQGTIAIETGNAEPVRLGERIMEDPALLFAVLEPTVSGRPTSREVILPVALLSAGLNDASSLSDEDKLRVGRALVSGNGAPRAPEAGMALLKPLADGGNGGAAVALAKAMAAGDAAGAYAYALRAGADGAAGAASLMDRLEQGMTTAMVLEAQAAGLSDTAPMPSPHDFVPLADARASALAHLRGEGAVRSYARAYYWALLGQAANDGAASSLAVEIEARMQHRGEAAAEAWRAAADQARADAMAHWLTADYPANLTGE